MMDSIAKEKRWGKKCLESCAIKGGGSFSSFLFSLFFPRSPGYFVHCLEKSSKLCRKKHRVGYVQLPPGFGARHPTPSVTMWCRYIFAKQLGAPHAKLLTNSLPMLPPRFTLLHVFRGMSQVNSPQMFSHMNYRQRSDDCVVSQIKD